jgi:hypothetical protein
MWQIHADALAADAQWSVLCSSPSGLGLYQHLSYTILATMQAFVSAKTDALDPWPGPGE